MELEFRPVAHPIKVRVEPTRELLLGILNTYYASKEEFAYVNEAFVPYTELYYKKSRIGNRLKLIANNGMESWVLAELKFDNKITRDLFISAVKPKQCLKGIVTTFFKEIERSKKWFLTNKWIKEEV